MKLVAHAPLREMNSLHLPGSACWLATVDSVDELVALVRDARFAGLPRRMLGGGSNVVLSGDEVPGLVIRAAFAGWRVVARDASRVRVAADAGLDWHALVSGCVDAGLGGLENLALIPGTVGAAPVQNIGAYGVEFERVFHSLDAVHLVTGERRVFDRAACAFAYRDSAFKHDASGWAIVEVRLDLDTATSPSLAYRDLQDEWAARGRPAPTARLVFDMVCDIRRRKLPDPARVGNAGSFFKNPVVDAAQADRLRERYPGLVTYPQADGRVKIAAGWLIDQAGWKGHRRGDAGVHDRQALVLVNHGSATGRDILALADAIVDSVSARFGVVLEREPVLW